MVIALISRYFILEFDIDCKKKQVIKRIKFIIFIYFLKIFRLYSYGIKNY